MNASGKVHGRFGGRDASGPDSRNTLEGLHFAMKSALEQHRKDPTAKPDTPAKKPMPVESFPTAKAYRGCIHCHQVKEVLREEAIKAGTWTRDSIYTYPLPENVGITLDRKEGNLVQAVTPNSPADRAGLKPGDRVETINKVLVRSFADAQYGLHRSPARGEIPITWRRDGKDQAGALAVEPGWRRTNVTWRPSLLDLLPSLTVYGSDLTTKEKEVLGLPKTRLAFRQEAPVHQNAKKMGVLENDIILGVDGKNLDMTMEQFLGYVRQNYLVGESVTLNILRNRKRVDLKVQLK
jgi:hypothetical protein